MLKIWGRSNSVNVQKVLWCCDELGLEFTRVDAGLQFGVNDQPAYLAMNPNGRVPTIEDDGFQLWESNAIIRYLAMEYGRDGLLYPTQPRTRGGVERWLDWTISTLLPAERLIFLGYVRTPPGQRDEALLRSELAKLTAVWRILDEHLAARTFAEGDVFSLADIALGCFARRWFKNPGITRTPFANLERWFGSLEQRASYRRHLEAPLS